SDDGAGETSVLDYDAFGVAVGTGARLQPIPALRGGPVQLLIEPYGRVAMAVHDQSLKDGTIGDILEMEDEDNGNRFELNLGIDVRVVIHSLSIGAGVGFGVWDGADVTIVRRGTIVSSSDGSFKGHETYARVGAAWQF
ncbi:MAG: hypothetical protein ACYTF0_05110, partial [Planctomycetota bacterium]